ncbi:ATP:dephospho-CoA triphosphoribosyl transferase [Planctomycetes bacterium Pan216]|uniref:ATP:dephospho-CoA triphosphoribosyl transferase n=1 Tax=Kolteria novifilia TaxID=2527975 RepID=A0A518AYK6_9BACT|nr:ATP:dephospho-CoA triphosphoribosyl transferase [Planctomycetes bacterium Pan216]
MSTPSDIATNVQLASLLETISRKAGNVHPGARFDDLSLLDLAGGGIAIGPVLANAPQQPLGATILEAVRATRHLSRSNANLGIILLLAPLASVSANDLTPDNVERVLATTTVSDSIQTFEAIRLANPGGLGEANEQDVASQPTESLRDVMRLAASRDLIAKQYADGFVDLFDFGVPTLTRLLGHRVGTEEAVVRLHLEWLATYPDSLIARKSSFPTAEHVSEKTRTLLARIPMGCLLGDARYWAFDAWLREERHNPGTSADFVAASLYVALQTGVVRWKELADHWR